MPLWWNPLFNIKQRALIDSWRDHLGMVRIRDTITKDTRLPLDDEDITDRFDDCFRRAGSSGYHASGGKIITLNSILKQWNNIIETIPKYILKTARGITLPDYTKYGPGARMLRRAGWRPGQGIGKTPGRAHPVETPEGTSNRAGLGIRIKPNRKSKITAARKKYKATMWEGTLQYGTYEPSTSTFTCYDLTTRGRPYPANRSYTIPSTNIAEALWWGSGIVGAATRYFPHPKGWKVRGPDCFLDEVSVKKLTLAYTLPKQIPPSCIAAWEQRLGSIDWRQVGLKYTERLLTPKDFMTHFKLILHRALYTRHINPDCLSRLATNCRLCHAATERIGHLPDCSTLQPIFSSFLRLAGCNPTDPTDRSRLLLLGLASPPLPQALSDLHLIMWKFILIHFTLVDLEHKPFRPRDVWLGAVRRYASKANKLTHKVRVKQGGARRSNVLLSRLTC